MAQHTVVHALPDGFQQRCVDCGLDWSAVLAFIEQAGQTAIDILTQIMDIFFPAAAEGLHSTAIDWAKVFALVQQYGTIAVQILTFILANLPKTPAP